MKPKIYITRRLPNEILTVISQHCEILMWEKDTPVPREMLIEKIKNVDGLLCMLTETVDKEILQHAKKLNVISNMAVGFNNIDVETAAEMGIPVTNTPGVLTETTADLTFALLMATARRLHESEYFLRKGDWKTWSPMLLTGQDIHHATIGIIGLGRIGEAIAKRAKGFGMKILYHNRTRKKELEKHFEIEYREFNELLKEADFICVLTPLTSETKNLISHDQFAMMKKNAILINTSRGGIVNEEALISAIKNRQIWGAGLDVFEEEPLPKDHPLLELKNVIVTPHIGSASINTRMKMASLAVDNLLTILSGEDNENIVNSHYKYNK